MIKYNPMSKEFQDECKKLGLTGRQLTAKYKKEGKSIEKDDIYKDRRGKTRLYTDEQLLGYLIQFYERYGRPPTERDIIYNSWIPSLPTYQNRFGSWSNALKLVGLDTESMVKKGVIETSDQKARLSEIIIRDHYKVYPTDLAGKNKKSPCDGICPNGMTYDVKSSGLSFNGRQYTFDFRNKYKEKIEILYLLGFNKDYTTLYYAWRVDTWEFNGDHIVVNVSPISSRGQFVVRKMKQYDITEKLREILIKYGYFDKIKNYIKAKEKGLTIYEYDKQLYDGFIIAE